MEQPNQNELEVLRLLWNKSPQKPGEIQESFGWEIDNGTLRSVLVSMVERGMLTRQREGRAYLYAPKLKRETHLRQMVRRLAEVFTGGSTGQLLMELAEKERLSPQELKQLKKIARGEK